VDNTDDHRQKNGAKNILYGSKEKTDAQKKKAKKMLSISTRYAFKYNKCIGGINLI